MSSGRVAWSWKVAEVFGKRLALDSVILLYHRVIELPLDPHALCVTPRHFAEHLEMVRKYGCPMRLLEYCRALLEDNLPPRAVVVTFDDGYADSFHNARLLLERFDIPATIFVTTGYFENTREFWWDELESLLLQPGRLPEALSLLIEGREYRWELGGAAWYSEDAWRDHQRWSVLEGGDPTPRHLVYRALHKLLRPLPESRRRLILDGLWHERGASRAVRPTHRILSRDEVTGLAASGLIEIGAHTVTHPVLSTMSVADQEVEIRGSKACLENILGRRVESFAYPYGTRSDYTPETALLVRKAGFASGCSNFAAVIRPNTDPFQLPRILVRDSGGEAFGRWLKESLRG